MIPRKRPLERLVLRVQRTSPFAQRTGIEWQPEGCHGFQSDIYLLGHLKREITRKRLYLQTMEGVFGRSAKVLLDADNSGNVLYLPLDHLSGNGRAQNRMPPVVTPDGGVGVDSPSPSRDARREGRQ